LKNNKKTKEKQTNKKFFLIFGRISKTFFTFFVIFFTRALVLNHGLLPYEDFNAIGRVMQFPQQIKNAHKNGFFVANPGKYILKLSHTQR